MGVEQQYLHYQSYSNDECATPSHSVPKLSWCEKNQKYKPQSNSMSAGFLIFISGGMNIAFSFGFTSTNFSLMTMHMKICWFVGAIIGAFIGAISANSVKKKPLLLLGAFLTTIGGVLFIALPANYFALLAARYIDGVSNGVAFVIVLVMAGEEAVKSLRGMIAASGDAMCFSMGIFLQILYSTLYIGVAENSFSVEQIQGVNSVLYGGMAILFGLFLAVESPIFFLVRNQEQRAIESLRKLQRPFAVSFETFEQLAEHKRLIALQSEMTYAQTIIAGLPALFRLCFYRVMVAFSFSAALSYGLILFCTKSGISSGWPLIAFGTVRWVGSLIAVFLMDSVGRRKPMLVGVFICGVTAIAAGLIFGSFWHILNNFSIMTAVYLLLVFEFFAGIFIASSSVYLCEAFPLTIKPYYIAITFTTEMIVQIIICIFHTNVSNYLYIIGILAFLFWIMGFLCLPETKLLTLREAQIMFRKLRSVSAKPVKVQS